MITPAHFFGGYISLQLSKKLWMFPELTSNQTLGLLIFGLLLSVGIDLDVLVTGGITGHHKQLTHYPFFWLALSVVIFGLGLFFKQRFIQSLAIVTFIASWTHMVLDLFGVTMGIHWLWPFSMKEFSVTPIQPNFVSEQERWNFILKSPAAWVGGGVVILGGLAKMSFDLIKGLLK